MNLLLNGWAGDNAGKVQGRKPYHALISLTYADAARPRALHEHVQIPGSTWYYNIGVACLTPGSAPAIVTDVEAITVRSYPDLSCVYSLKVRPLEPGDDEAHWQPGVHLFSISMIWEYSSIANSLYGAIASVVVPNELPKALRFSDFSSLEEEVLRQRGK